MNPAGDQQRIIQGGLFIVSAMAVIGLIDNMIPMIATEAGLWQFHAVRSIMSIPLIVLLLRIRNRSFRPLQPLILAIRSVLIAGSMLLYFGSLALMPIAEAGAGLFAAPIFVLIFSVLLFRKRIGIFRIAAVLVGFSGVLLVLKPDLGNLDLIVLFPLFAAVLYGLGQLMTRHFCSNEDTFVILLAFYLAIGLFGIVGVMVFSLATVPDSWRAAAPFFTEGWRTPTASFLAWTFVQAIGSLIAVAGLIRGYQIADPTYMGVFEYSFLLFAGFWGWVFWSQIPDAFSLLGIFAIIAAGTAITTRSQGKRAL